MSVSRLHHMGWSLLHLATGCALMGGLSTSSTYRSRPEPDCANGFASCVALLLAAGADPNVKSKQHDYTPLIGACLSGDAECCRLLLQAGAVSVDRKTVEPSEPTQTAVEAARKARLSEDRKREVLAVLDSPPKRLPRSPLDVRARLLEQSLDGDDRDRSVEVRWRSPPNVGDIQRYVVRGYADGEEIDVKRDVVGVLSRGNKAGTAPPNLCLRRRRDFCKNDVVDRGIALRQNLGLPVPVSASTLIHGLTPGLTYNFTVSCIAIIDTEIRESPPSLPSNALDIPAIDDDDWNTAEIIEKVLSYGTAAAGAATSTAHKGTSNVVVVVGGSDAKDDSRPEPSTNPTSKPPPPPSDAQKPTPSSLWMQNGPASARLDQFQSPMRARSGQQPQPPQRADSLMRVKLDTGHPLGEDFGAPSASSSRLEEDDEEEEDEQPKLSEFRHVPEPLSRKHGSGQLSNGQGDCRVT